MKVFYTHDVFTVQRHGGISRYFVELAKRLHAAGSDIRIFAGLHVNDYLREVGKVAGLRVPGIRYSGVVRRNVNRRLQAIVLPFSGVDVVHQTYYSAVPLAKRFAGKLVLTVYDMTHEVLPHEFVLANRTTQDKMLCCTNADHIIAISHATKNDLMRLFNIPSEKITVTHLASSFHSIEPASPSLVPDDPFLLFVGLRGGYKNLAVLLEAFRQSERLRKDFKIVCFGGGPLTPSEVDKLNAAGLGDRVIQVSGGDALLAAYYRKARAHVYPSKYEGFGLPPLEAMSMRCPVVCANTSSIPEVVGDAGFYFAPDSPEQLKAVLEANLYDDSTLAARRTLGRQRASEFSWDRCAEETMAVYRSLVA